MKERPILFSGEMVRAILDGRKGQTRRVVKFPKAMHETDIPDAVSSMNRSETKTIGRRGPCDGYQYKWSCPYGKVGDRLWVRETFGLVPITAYGATTPHRQNPDDRSECAIYIADFDRCWSTRKRPAIHMPRWASRITLEITDVRVERLQSISSPDAQAEGVHHDMPVPGGKLWILTRPLEQGEEPPALDGYQWGFSLLWDGINKERGYSWESNPWVWAITFKRVESEATQ